MEGEAETGESEGELGVHFFDLMLLYITLLFFFMMISCYHIELKENHDEKLLDFFQRKILDDKSSNLWRRMFLWLRHIQIIALISLFCIGSSDMNNL